MATRSAKIDQKADLIWAIADKLTGVYKPHEYGDVILPLTVIRRFDCILSDTKDAVLQKYDSGYGDNTCGHDIDSISGCLCFCKNGISGKKCDFCVTAGCLYGSASDDHDPEIYDDHKTGLGRYTGRDRSSKYIQCVYNVYAAAVFCFGSERTG